MSKASSLSSRRSFLLGSGIAVAALAMFGCGSTTPARPTPEPKRGQVLWGMFIHSADPQSFGFKPDLVHKIDQQLGHPIEVFHWYQQWPNAWKDVVSNVRKTIASGWTPFITWEAFNAPLGTITSGGLDAYIDSWAHGIAQLAPKVVWLRIFHEFNDRTDYPWQTTKNSPATFIAAWKHIHDRFAAAGASNVRWIWNFDGTSSPTLGDLAPAYPGDEYVDFTGWDGADDGTNYNLTLQVAPHKPMVVGEVYDSNGDEDSMLRGMARMINAGNMPLIRAVVYFDEGGATLAPGRANLETVKSMLSGPAFQ
jgi:hypothetical protein